MAIYMKFASIDGTVSADGYVKWIELNSLQWGIGRGISSPTGTDVEREASAPSISEVVVTKQLDGSSNKLITDALAGVLDSNVDIVFTVTVKNKTSEFLRYTLKQCGLSGYSVSSGGDRPTESLSLNFTSVSIKYMAMDSAGQGKPDVIGYSLAKLSTI